MRTRCRTKQLLAIALLATFAGIVASLGITAGAASADAPSGASFSHARSEATFVAATNHVSRAARQAAPLLAILPAVVLSLLTFSYATSRPRAIPAIVGARASYRPRAPPHFVI